jgi:transcriptional regulator with GAF, ATPase, and Fis domain
MEKSLSSGKGLAHELSDVQPVNGVHPDAKSQLTIHSNGTVFKHCARPARLTRPEAFAPIVYVSHAMDQIIDKIERSRDSPVPALITGETGTGKELIARAIHAASARYGREFIPFNCGDSAPDLIASRLFGYRRGAFTGADRDSKGVIREADGGTLFLDEIGELSLAAQPQLLRFLQEYEISPLGEARPIKVNVRVIAATNRDLDADVRAGRFRSDLYHRLNVFRIHIPPLRERREDIRPLLEHFITLRRRESSKQWLRLSDEVWEPLLGYGWPGNVREVESLSHRLVASAASGEVIGRKGALDAIRDGIRGPQHATDIIKENAVIALDQPLRKAIDKLERLLIQYALEETGGNLLRAAARLKVDRSGLRKMIARLGIEVERTGPSRSRK